MCCRHSTNHSRVHWRLIPAFCVCKHSPFRLPDSMGASEFIQSDVQHSISLPERAELINDPNSHLSTLLDTIRTHPHCVIQLWQHIHACQFEFEMEILLQCLASNPTPFISHASVVLEYLSSHMEQHQQCSAVAASSHENERSAGKYGAVMEADAINYLTLLNHVTVRGKCVGSLEPQILAIVLHWILRCSEFVPIILIFCRECNPCVLNNSWMSLKHHKRIVCV